MLANGTALAASGYGESVGCLFFPGALVRRTYMEGRATVKEG